MQTAGLAEVALKQKGCRSSAYDLQGILMVPDGLQVKLDQITITNAFIKWLDFNNPYAILFRPQTTREAAIRAKHLRQFVEMLERGEKIHS